MPHNKTFDRRKFPETSLAFWRFLSAGAELPLVTITPM
jgi:hypothetical protein